VINSEVAARFYPLAHAPARSSRSIIVLGAFQTLPSSLTMGCDTMTSAPELCSAGLVAECNNVRAGGAVPQ
jgi:hypothetical protein